MRKTRRWIVTGGVVFAGLILMFAGIFAVQRVDSNPLLFWMFYRGVNKIGKNAWISGQDGRILDLREGSEKVVETTVQRSTGFACCLFRSQE